MIAVLIPSCDSVEDAFSWLERHGGRLLRVVLMHGEDGRIRGNALIARAKAPA